MECRDSYFIKVILLLVAILHFTHQGTTPPEYHAVVGGKGELPCNISVPSPNDKVSLVLWYKGDSRVPMYSIDTRNSPLDQAKHFPSDSLLSRAVFDMIAEPSVLRIEPVREDDEGIYRCRVDFRWGRTYSSTVILNVTVPPEKTIITDDKDQMMSGIIGPYDEGADVQLKCDGIGGKPSPAVLWWRGSTILDDSYYVMEDGIVRNEVTIPNFQRNDLMTILTCQATNNNVTAPVSTSVTVDLNLKPLDVHITTTQAPLSANVKVEIECVSSGGRPPARITWHKDNEELKNVTEKISADGNITTSILKFWPSGEDNGRYLSCRSDNPLLPDSALEDGWILNISYVPRVTLDRSGSDIQHSVREGSDVYFHCNINSNPPFTKIGWQFEGRPLFHNPPAGVIINNQSLVMQKVRRANKGRFRCYAVNSEGMGESSDVSLLIDHTPVCAPGQKIVYGVAKDETARVECEVQAEPPEVSFHWVFNNSFDKHNIRTFSNDGLKSLATHTPRSMNDYGTLYCYAKNSIGKQTEPCIFTIIPVGPPEPVRNCSVANVTSESLLVECDAGHSGGLRQYFYIEVHNSAAGRLEGNVTNLEVPMFHISNLPSATAFILVIYAANAKGKSDSVTLRTKTLVASQNNSGNLNTTVVNPLLGVLICVVAALVMVPGIAMVIIRMRGTDEDKGHPDETSMEKAETLLKKNPEDYPDNDAKDPDLIPPKSNYFDYPSEEREWYSFRRSKATDKIYDNHIPGSHLLYDSGGPSTAPCQTSIKENIKYSDLGPPQEISASALRHREAPVYYTEWESQRRPSPRGRDRMEAYDEHLGTPLMTRVFRSSEINYLPSNERRTLSTPV
ncbi:protein turtle homolog B-like isoform X2 [Centruroides vittatus]|uniref:protein turtle homolog B-like isoform X2 n=1 Tax=Centruroides vittatus TaxID=120091 RepID=UPI0035104014